MALKQNHTTFELEDGTTVGPVRVIFADKIQFEKSAKANGWSTEDAIHLQSFLTWHAAKREGLISATYEEFTAQLIDIKFDSQVDVGEAVDPT